MQSSKALSGSVTWYCLTIFHVSNRQRDRRVQLLYIHLSFEAVVHGLPLLPKYVGEGVASPHAGMVYHGWEVVKDGHLDACVWA
jgi:hypothetical protein